MANYLATNLDVLIQGKLAKAKDNSTTRVIETQLLDGSFTVQTIGLKATKVDIEHYCSIATRRDLDAKLSTAEPIKVWWKDKTWTGLISGGAIKYERWSKTKTDLAEKVEFTLMVTAEADQ